LPLAPFRAWAIAAHGRPARQRLAHAAQVRFGRRQEQGRQLALELRIALGEPAQVIQIEHRLGGRDFAADG
jgi:hypothetical protein